MESPTPAYRPATVLEVLIGHHALLAKAVQVSTAEALDNGLCLGETALRVLVQVGQQAAMQVEVLDSLRTATANRVAPESSPPINARGSPGNLVPSNSFRSRTKHLEDARVSGHLGCRVQASPQQTGKADPYSVLSFELPPNDGGVLKLPTVGHSRLTANRSACRSPAQRRGCVRGKTWVVHLTRG
jgi:hypothetical protein